MKKKILITGANGMLGTRLVKQLLKDSGYQIVAVISSEDRYKEWLKRLGDNYSDRIEYVNSFELSRSSITNVYASVHLAFSRRNRSAVDIANSIDYSATVFKKLVELKVKRVINISSQGIYGDTEEFRTESTPPAPITSYTMAKYATEKLFQFYFEGTGIEFTSLRLDLVAQSQNLIPALCKQAKEGRINLKGGEQRFSFIDADDAVTGIVSMLNSSSNWNSVYNLGWNRKRFSLIEMAEIVSNVAENLGYKKPEIILDKQDICLWAGMDSSKFTEHTKWNPKIDIYQIVEKMM